MVGVSGTPPSGKDSFLSLPATFCHQFPSLVARNSYDVTNNQSQLLRETSLVSTR